MFANAVGGIATASDIGNVSASSESPLGGLVYQLDFSDDGNSPLDDSDCDPENCDHSCHRAGHFSGALAVEPALGVQQNLTINIAFLKSLYTFNTSPPLTPPPNV